MIYLNIGTNLGDRAQNLLRAAARIMREFGPGRLSAPVESEPWGFASPNRFMNICLAIDLPLPTDLPPHHPDTVSSTGHIVSDSERSAGEEGVSDSERSAAREEASDRLIEGLHAILDRLQAIEREFSPLSHRNADGSYADRLIDIDIAAVTLPDGSMLRIDTPRLTLPHRHLYSRDFFLTPLRELCPHL